MEPKRPNFRIKMTLSLAAAAGLVTAGGALLHEAPPAHAQESPADAVQLVPGDSRESVRELMRARGLVDVLIPRGGASLIRTVVEESTVPVIETGTGNCHVYVDAQADLDTAVEILINSKAQRPSVCNAAETLLVHQDIAPEFLPRALDALAEAGVTVHGDERVMAYAKDSRATVVTLTDAGSEALAAWKTQLGTALAPLFADLTDAEWAALEHASRILTYRAAAVPAATR